MITHAQRQVIQVNAAISMVRFLADKQAANAQLHVDSNVVGINPNSDLSSMLIGVRTNQEPQKLKNFAFIRGLSIGHTAIYSNIVMSFQI